MVFRKFFFFLENNWLLAVHRLLANCAAQTCANSVDQDEPPHLDLCCMQI